MKYFSIRTTHLIYSGLGALALAVACDDGGGFDESLEGDGDGDEDQAGDGDSDGGLGGGAHEGLPPFTSGDGGAGPVGLPVVDEEVPVMLPPLEAPPACGLSAAPFLMGGNVNQSGYLHVQGDISSTGSIDGGAVTALDGATSHSVLADGTAYVSFWEKPIIEKWEFNGVDEFERTGTLSLANAGVSSTGSTRSLVQITRPNRAYYIDPENNYVLGFNPSTMEANGAFIDLTEGFGPANEVMALGDVHRDGDHLIVTARYWDEDFNVKPIIRAAFIDATDDSVTFAEDTRCGDIGWHATDSAGNLYLGSHWDNVAANHVEAFGVTGTDSCIVRILRGQRSFDQDYYVDMDQLVDGIGTTLLQGPGDQAYVMKYAGDPITNENWDEVRGGATWDLYAITLGDEANSLTQVDFGGDKFNPTPTLFCSNDNRSIVGFSGNDFEDGQLFVINAANSATAALSYSGALGAGVSLE